MRRDASTDPLQELPSALLFAGGNGETCARLIPAWDDFFGLINLLGPVLVGMHDHPFTSVNRLESVEFHRVPASDEFIDLQSNWVVRTDIMAGTIAVRESRPANHFGLQFFDPFGSGLFKILLTPESNWDVYAELVERFVTTPCPVQPNQSRHLVTPPIFGERAQRSVLVHSLITAHRYRFSLAFQISTPAQDRSLEIRPCRLESRNDDFLLTNCCTEICIAATSELKLVRIRKPNPSQCPASLGIRLASGGMLEVQFAGPPESQPQWDAVHALS